MFSSLARLDRPRLRRRHPLRPRRTRQLRAGSSERHPSRRLGSSSSSRHHQNPLRKTRRLALRQRLGQRPGSQQRRLRRNAPRRRHDRRLGSRRPSNLHSRVARTAPNDRRPRRLHLRAPDRRHLGHPSSSLPSQVPRPQPMASAASRSSIPTRLRPPPNLPARPCC